MDFLQRIRFILLAGVAALIVFSLVSVNNTTRNQAGAMREKGPIARVTVGSATVRVELAVSEEEQAKGLSGREKIAADRGILFLYDTAVRPTFWMKDMKFPLDLIWIYGDRVVDITYRAAAPSGPVSSYQKYVPMQVVDKVLEVNAGWVMKNKIKINDKIVIEQ